MQDNGDGGSGQGPDRQDRPDAPVTDLTEIRPAATDERSGERFDPTPYLRQLRGRGGGQDYLDVRWRLLWLRREHPDAEIVTEHVQIEEASAIFKATVRLPSGGMATGYGSETASDFGDFIEKAETKAIGRALNALGYGAQFGERGAEEMGSASAPSPSPEPPGRPARPAPARPSPTAPPPATAMNEEAGTDVAPRAATRRRAAPEPTPIDLAAERERATESQPPVSPPESATAPGGEEPVDDAPPAGGTIAEAGPDEDADEPDLADYSWTVFWPWARGLGLNSPKAIEALIGQEIAGRSPAEVRTMILAARDER